MKLSALFFILLVFCSLSADITSRLIVNGSETNYAEWKGVVGFVMKDKVGNTMLCTGSLIDPEIVLTAGHCVYAKGEYYTLTPFNGAKLNLSAVNAIAGVKKVVKHPKWNGGNAQDETDLALVQLDKKITDIEYYPIRNAPAEKDAEKGTIVGYGDITSASGSTAYGVHRKGTTTLKRLMLIGNLNVLEVGDPSGACNGDSGGPFFLNVSGKPVISGVAAFVEKGCSATGGSYYVHVLSYSKWIMDTVKELTGHGLIDPAAKNGCGAGCSTGYACINNTCERKDLRYDCAGLMQCFGGCSPSDAPCNTSCFFGTNEDGQAKYDAMYACYDKYCANEPDNESYEKCGAQKCPAEYKACYGSDPVQNDSDTVTGSDTIPGSDSGVSDSTSGSDTGGLASDTDTTGATKDTTAVSDNDIVIPQTDTDTTESKSSSGGCSMNLF